MKLIFELNSQKFFQFDFSSDCNIFGAISPTYTHCAAVSSLQENCKKSARKKNIKLINFQSRLSAEATVQIPMLQLRRQSATATTLQTVAVGRHQLHALNAAHFAPTFYSRRRATSATACGIGEV